MPLSETQHCIELAIWLDRRNILYTHVPNGGFRNAKEASIFRRMGVKRGVPDYLIFTPPPGNQLNGNDDVIVGVALEMKRATGGAISAPQKRWRYKLEELSWISFVCYGHEQAIERLTELGYDS
jgi:hypothetical protein